MQNGQGQKYCQYPEHDSCASAFRILRCRSCLDVSPFSASIDVGAFFTVLTIPRALRYGCQFFRHQKLLFFCPCLFLPQRSVHSGLRQRRNGISLFTPIWVFWFHNLLGKVADNFWLTSYNKNKNKQIERNLRSLNVHPVIINHKCSCVAHDFALLHINKLVYNLQMLPLKTTVATVFTQSPQVVVFPGLQEQTDKKQKE
jgi:hypothetical protein